MLARVDSFFEQHAQILLLRAVLKPLSTHPVSVLGIALTQAQGLALGLVELHDIGIGLPLNPVQVIVSLTATLSATIQSI